MSDPTPRTALDRAADRAVDRRRFSDAEVAAILRRAAELQESQAAGGGATGMSLAELEDVAREAGLDPALVRHAASEVATAPAAAPASPFLGAPTRISTERTVEGEVTTDDLAAMLEEVRRTVGDPGEMSVLGRTVTWRTTPMNPGRGTSQRALHVSITPRAGRTVIRAEEDLGGLAGGLFGGLMGGLGGGLGGPALGIGLTVFHPAVLAVAAAGAIVGGSYALARTIYTTTARRRRATIEGLLDRLAAYVEPSPEPAR